MSEHTPGPWKVCRRFDVYQDLGPQVGGTYIGTTRGNGPLPESCELVDEANARLVAAAPEMLTVLRGLLDSYECYWAHQRPEIEWDEYDEVMLPRWKAAKTLVQKLQGMAS